MTFYEYHMYACAGARGRKVMDNRSFITPDIYWTKNLVPGPYSADSHGHSNTGLTQQAGSIHDPLTKRKTKNLFLIPEEAQLS